MYMQNKHTTFNDHCNILLVRERTMVAVICHMMCTWGEGIEHPTHPTSLVPRLSCPTHKRKGCVWTLPGLIQYIA